MHVLSWRASALYSRTRETKLLHAALPSLGQCIQRASVESVWQHLVTLRNSNAPIPLGIAPANSADASAWPSFEFALAIGVLPRIMRSSRNLDLDKRLDGWLAEGKDGVIDVPGLTLELQRGYDPGGGGAAIEPRIDPMNAFVCDEAHKPNID